jgi:hypothetical protein
MNFNTNPNLLTKSNARFEQLDLFLLKPKSHLKLIIINFSHLSKPNKGLLEINPHPNLISLAKGKTHNILPIEQGIQMMIRPSIRAN